jgi:hypothetical protein
MRRLHGLQAHVTATEQDRLGIENRIHAASMQARRVQPKPEPTPDRHSASRILQAMCPQRSKT